MDLAWELTQRTYDYCQQFNDPILSYKRLIGTIGERDDKPPIELITSTTDA
jgi:hypothetical protein